MTTRTALRTCVAVNVAAATLPAITVLAFRAGGEGPAAIVAIGIVAVGFFHLLTMAVALWLRGEKGPAFVCGTLSTSPLTLRVLDGLFLSSVGGRP